MATKITLTYLSLMNIDIRYSVFSWQLENAKAKCSIEKINNSALDFLQMKIATLIVLRKIRHAVYCLISFPHGTSFRACLYDLGYPGQPSPRDNITKRELRDRDAVDPT